MITRSFSRSFRQDPVIVPFFRPLLSDRGPVRACNHGNAHRKGHGNSRDPLPATAGVFHALRLLCIGSWAVKASWPE